MSKFIISFFISCGVVLGGTIFAGIGAIITREPPLKTILALSSELKIWAAVVALGGTFSSLKLIESVLFGRQFSILGEQILLIFFAFAGAHLAHILIMLLFGG